MKKSAIKWYVMGSIVLCMLMAFVYIYNKPHRQISKEIPLLTIQAHELFTQYTSNEKAANHLYLDKVIQVQGAVGEIIANDQGGITLLLKNKESPFGVSCTMQQNQKKQINSVHTGDWVVIKGLCTGMLMDVVLINCVRIE